MRIRSIPVAVATVLVATLAAGVMISGPASAVTSSQAAKEKVAVSLYAKAIKQARLAFLAEVKPARHAVLVVGKKSELVRRTKVKVALRAFNSVAIRAKAPVLAAEKSYRVAVTKLAANPGNASLKANVKASLLTVTRAAAALKVNSRIAAAQVAFKKARLAAMATFKSTLARSVKVRGQAQARAMLKFKAAKIKALSNLKAAIKLALASP
jgi:hypothetical protein